MESDDDLVFSVPAGAVQSPVQQTKLKRLKKASNISKTSTPESPFLPKSVTDDSGEHLLEERAGGPIGSPSPMAEILNASALVSESHSIETILIEEDSVRSNRSFPSSDNFVNEEGRHVNYGFSDDLGALSQDGQDKLGSLDDCTPEAQEERNNGCTATEEIADGSGKMSAKKRSSMDDGDDEKRRRKKKVKNANADCNPETTKPTKRRLAKERKCYLDMIHAESQKLLRETRDASFRPAPVVQKPISSVLEKIRQRKLEVLKKSYSSDVSDSFTNNDASLGDTTERRLESAKGDKSQEGENDDKDCGLPLPTMDAEDGFITAAEKNSPRSVSSNKCDHGTRESINSALIQDHSTHSQSHSENNQLEDGSSQSGKEDSNDNQLEDDSNKLCEEEYFSPSVLAEKLKEESILPESDSSGEEDDDKENIDPHPGGDPVKAFVDDEAEEEDSDRELMIDHGSSDENEEKETGEYEEFKDLIASGYEEKAVDTERRDELHQKWLQQQDAAETENILQRLKCGLPQKAEESLLYDEEEYDRCDMGPLDEEMPDLPPVSGSRIKTKELKLMISKMFTDCEDPFLSDEEENETRLARQLYHNKSEEAASFLSPVENESSREVFGLIKKLNIAPENKRRAKTSSFLETLVKGSNGTSSSKSSFLGRAHSSTLPSARKQGVTTVRSFVFGRDDSNSRSGISTSAESAGLNRKEKQQAKKISAKHSTTSKSFSQEGKKETRTASGPSLFQILRASSVQSSASVYSEKLSSTRVFGQTQADYQFTAFKSSRKTTKVET